MKILCNISDVRNYRQIGKQINSDEFKARINEVQNYELSELLGKALSYDFFNFLDTGFSEQAGTFVVNSDYTFTAQNIDLSAFVNYSLRINDSTFVIVKSADFDGTDTFLEIMGYILPSIIVKLEYSTENKYIKLLNGSIYTVNNKTIDFKGLRPFIAWKFLSIFVTDGSLKHSDVGNISILSDNYERPSSQNLNNAKATYLSNAAREENNIIDYLNENSNTYPLWELKGETNIETYNMIVI